MWNSVLVRTIAASILSIPFVASAQSDRTPPSDGPQPAQPPRRNVSPTLNIQATIAAYKRDLRADELREREYAAFKAEWVDFKKSGRTMWKSQEWMKSPEHYAALDTLALADECFERHTLSIEMMIYDDPRFGVIRLTTLHDGFAELVTRDDIWDGLVHVWKSKNAELNRDTNGDGIMRASMDIHGLMTLMRTLPLATTLRQHEMELYALGIESVRTYRDYLRVFRDENLAARTGHPIPFYTEPCEVVRFCLLLLSQRNPEAFRAAMEKLEPVRLWSDQRIDELEDYLTLAIDTLEKADFATAH